MFEIWLLLPYCLNTYGCGNHFLFTIRCSVSYWFCDQTAINIIIIVIVVKLIIIIIITLFLLLLIIIIILLLHQSARAIPCGSYMVPCMLSLYRMLVPPLCTSNLRTNIVDFRGFDSSIMFINRKGWNSHVHREFPGKFESSYLSRDNLSREIGRISDVGTTMV